MNFKKSAILRDNNPESITPLFTSTGSICFTLLISAHHHLTFYVLPLAELGHQAQPPIARELVPEIHL